MAAAPSWATLSSDILCHIASFFVPSDNNKQNDIAFPRSLTRKRSVDVFAMACTCSMWRTLLTTVENDATLWEPIIKWHFGDFMDGVVNMPNKSISSSCHDIFKVCAQIFTEKKKRAIVSPHMLWGELLSSRQSDTMNIKDCIFTAVVEHSREPFGSESDRIVGVARIGDRESGILSIRLAGLHRKCMATTIRAYDPADYADLSSDGTVDVDNGIEIDDYWDRMTERNSLQRAEERRLLIRNFGIRKLEIYLTIPSSLKTVLVQTASQWYQSTTRELGGVWDTMYADPEGFIGLLDLKQSRSCRLLLDRQDYLTVIFEDATRHGHYAHSKKEKNDQYDGDSEVELRLLDIQESFLRHKYFRKTQKTRKRKRRRLDSWT